MCQHRKVNTMIQVTHSWNTGLTHASSFRCEPSYQQSSRQGQRTGSRCLVPGIRKIFQVERAFTKDRKQETFEKALWWEGYEGWGIFLCLGLVWFFVVLLFEIGFPCVAWLSWKLLCKPGWPCCLLNAGIKSVSHHTARKMAQDQSVWRPRLYPGHSVFKVNLSIWSLLNKPRGTKAERLSEK